LFQWILKRGFISEAATPAITTHIILGLKVLHDNGMTHLDLKPENILIVESLGHVFTVKLTDYLLDGVFDEELKIIGTRSVECCAAPEVAVTCAISHHSNSHTAL
jgi:serine/threonine protein kinase